MGNSLRIKKIKRNLKHYLMILSADRCIRVATLKPFLCIVQMYKYIDVIGKQVSQCQKKKKKRKRKRKKQKRKQIQIQNKPKKELVLFN